MFHILPQDIFLTHPNCHHPQVPFVPYPPSSLSQISSIHPLLPSMPHLTFLHSHISQIFFPWSTQMNLHDPSHPPNHHSLPNIAQVWLPLPAQQSISRILSEPSLPIPQVQGLSHINSNLSTWPDLTPHFTLEPGGTSCTSVPVCFAHLTSFHPNQFQLLGPTCPHILSFAPTCSVHIRPRTN